MVSEKMIKALNDQLQREFQSSYIYMGMEAYFADKNLKGFENFFHIQTMEERDHAYKFFNYINRVGGKVELQALEAVSSDYANEIEAFEKTLVHEQFITKSIHDLLDLAIDERDHTTTAFLQWFITEQAEEEETADGILRKLKMINSNPSGLFMVDSELAQRVYNPPVAE